MLLSQDHSKNLCDVLNTTLNVPFNIASSEPFKSALPLNTASNVAFNFALKDSGHLNGDRSGEFGIINPKDAMLLLADKYVKKQDCDDAQLLSRDNYINEQDSDQYKCADSSFHTNISQEKSNSYNSYKGFYLFGPHFDLYQSLNRLPI